MCFFKGKFINHNQNKSLQQINTHVQEGYGKTEAKLQTKENLDQTGN